MKPALVFRKARLLLHLFYGVWQISVHFPHASQVARHALIRAWSLKMLRLCGVSLVVHHHSNNDDYSDSDSDSGSGNSNAQTGRGAMIVSNHISWLDIFVINAWRPTPFVSKAEVRRWPLVGWFARQLDTIFLQREKRRDAMRIMDELAARLKRGESMCVFPEGTTSDGRALKPFHTNLFQAAVMAGRPVQPVCLSYEDAHGSQTLAPAYVDDVSLMQSVNAILRAQPLTAHIHVGNALPPGDDRRALAMRAQCAVQQALPEMGMREMKDERSELTLR